MAFQYFATARKGAAVIACATGNFTAPSHLNLIVAKNTHIEIFLVCPEGLKLMKEVGIYGKIAVMELFRPQNESKDLLFIVTAKYNAMILECQGVDDKIDIHTKAHGNVAESRWKYSETAITVVIDPGGRFIGLRIYEGLLKIILLEKEINELKIINVRLDESEIQDIQCMYGCANPTLILIYQDLRGRHVETLELSLTEKKFVKVLWSEDNIKLGANFLIPVPEPLCGVVIIGTKSVLYRNDKTFVAVTPPVFVGCTTITCYARLDSHGHKFVLGDHTGRLFSLILEKKENANGTFRLKEMFITCLGVVSIPECITYLDNDYLFIGSRIGDSQLVKVNKRMRPRDGSFIRIVKRYSNLASILDMEIVDLENQGQTQIITCSGALKEGSLRIIRSSIGIKELATMEFIGIKGMWATNIRSTSSLNNTIVLSFVGHSRILSLNVDEVEEIEIFGFLSEQQTMYCGNVSPTSLLQVVPTAIRLISLEPEEEVLSEWRPPVSKNISVVASNNFQIVCASGSDLFYLEIISEEIVEKKFRMLDFEVSCLDITPLPDKQRSEYIAVGLWNDISARILHAPSLDEVHKEYLGGEIISRSILFASFENIHYVLCALGDGSMFYFLFDPATGHLSEKKKITLGTQPIVLRAFRSKETTNVFACSDRSTVIYSSNHKLLFTNVNLQKVNYICSLNTEAYPDCLALATDTKVAIGKIDAIQKLHIRAVRLYEAPRRIAYQKSSRTFGVISSRLDPHHAGEVVINRKCASIRADGNSSSVSSIKIPRPANPSEPPESDFEEEVHNFLLLKQKNFRVDHAHEMLPNESCLSLISTKLGNDPKDYYVVGTAFINPAEPEPKLGRIIFFTIMEGLFFQVAEKQIRGACYSLSEFNGRLLASINSTVQLFEWTSDKKLKLQCTHYNNIIALYVKTKGNLILIGDMMRAITLLLYRPAERCFKEVAIDYNPTWMTAIEILNNDKFLGAENSLNLFVCHRDSSLPCGEEPPFMQEKSLFHLGDLVNVFRHGSLVMQNLGESKISTMGSVLFGTVNGTIGVLTQISRELFDLLVVLQERLAYVVKSVGNIEHSFWRSFSTEIKTEPTAGFIDGDLIESFLDLPRREMIDVINGIQITNDSGIKQDATVSDIIQIVEELTRLH